MARCAYVAEWDRDDGRGPLASGTFMAHVEDGDFFLAGPEDVPIEQALEWSREHAKRVVVRYAAPEGSPTHFSAGAEPVLDEDGAPIADWPPQELDLRARLMPGWEFLDRTDADEPIDWDVKIAVHQGWGDPVAEFATAFASRLADEANVRELDWVAGPGGGFTRESLGESRAVYAPLEAVGGEAVRVRFVLTARTQAEAVAAGKAASGRALDATLASLGIVRAGDEPFWWGLAGAAYPSGSNVARWNAGIHER